MVKTMHNDWTTGTVVVITPCLLGFDVKTYAATWSKLTGWTQGNGFIRPLGIFSASDLFRNLIDTPEPVQIKLK